MNDQQSEPAAPISKYMRQIPVEGWSTPGTKIGAALSL